MNPAIDLEQMHFGIEREEPAGFECSAVVDAFFATTTGARTAVWHKIDRECDTTMRRPRSVDEADDGGSRKS